MSVNLIVNSIPSLGVFFGGSSIPANALLDETGDPILDASGDYILDET